MLIFLYFVSHKRMMPYSDNSIKNFEFSIFMRGYPFQTKRKEMRFGLPLFAGIAVTAVAAAPKCKN